MIPEKSAWLHRAWFPWAMVLLAAWGAQLFAWNAAFYMDDFHHILYRDSVTGAEALGIGWKGRFLTFALWRGVYALFGADPVAFHGLNWFLHGAVALCSFAVLRGFVRMGPAHLRRHSQSLALWGAVLFAVHPLCVEPVHYAAQTSLLLATLFAMGAAGFFLRWRRAPGLGSAAGTVGCVLLAGMAKEPGFWHALILLFFLACLRGGEAGTNSRWWRESKWRLPLLLVGGLFSAVFVQAWLWTVLEHTTNTTTLTHHWLTQARVLGEYLRRFCIPVGLSSDHHIAWSVSWSDTEAVLKLIVTGAAVCWILERTLRGRRWFAALLGLCLFHLVLRFAYPLDEPMVEYRTYPSLPWFGLLLATVLREMTDLRFPRLRFLARPVLVIVAGSFLLLSWSRSHVWSDEQQLVRNVLHRYPLNLRAMGIYFKTLMLRGQPEAVVMGADLPDMVCERIRAHGEDGDRRFSERRMHLDYASCQYYIIRAHLRAGDVEAGLSLAESLLGDLLTGRRYGGADSFFTAFLSRALCYELLGRREDVEETWRMARPVVAAADELPETLEAELVLLRDDE